MVPFLDLKTQYRTIAPEVEPAVTRILAEGAYILGKEVEAFEKEFAAFLGAGHAIAVSSGLDALRIALQALGIGPGDEVITAANTFIATALSITGVGARPVLVDPDDATANIESSTISRAITPRTKAIMPVHLYGLPADMEPILALAKQHGLPVIEDACQAHGANMNGRRAGTFGEIGCFSFYPGKNLGAAGDGGMVVTNRPDLAEKLRRLRNYGQERKYYHVDLGGNHRLDEIQAAILRIKLRRLDGWNQARQGHARAYTQELSSMPLVLPRIPEGRTHIFHLYPVRTPRRDALQAHLTSRGIGTLIHYPIPIHLQPAYKHLQIAEGALPVAERMGRELLSLPMFPELTAAQIEEVVAVVRSFFA
ncbi:MAG: DegT/DnrJ/EryC1/StrS family aminotransferase [Candidatus Riflebacteria bacterium]|nr:DegT/DnrJ/EryC1/StrS family aminotransferase [Candidatus Riflebacteria bacterium]